MNQPLPTCLSDFKTQFDELCGDADKIIEKYKKKPMDILTKEFIDNLPNTSESIIIEYQKFISNEIKTNSVTMGIQKARQEANKKYGKHWRERLNIKKIYSHGNSLGELGHY